MKYKSSRLKIFKILQSQLLVAVNFHWYLLCSEPLYIAIVSFCMDYVRRPLGEMVPRFVPWNYEKQLNALRLSVALDFNCSDVLY